MIGEIPKLPTTRGGRSLRRYFQTQSSAAWTRLWNMSTGESSRPLSALSARQSGHTGLWSNPKIASLGSPLAVRVVFCMCKCTSSTSSSNSLLFLCSVLSLTSSQVSRCLCSRYSADATQVITVFIHRKASARFTPGPAKAPGQDETVHPPLVKAALTRLVSNLYQLLSYSPAV